MHSVNKRPLVNLVMCSLAHCAWHAQSLTLAPLLPLIQNDFSLSYTQVGLLVAVPTLLRAVLSIPVGYLSDKMGRKSFVSLGLALFAAAMFLMGFSHDFMNLLVFQTLAGIGSSTYHPIGPAIVAQSLPKDKGKAMGIEGVGGTVGSSLGPVLAGIVGVFLGWRAALWLLVLPGFVISLGFWKFYYDPRKEFSSEETSDKFSTVTKIPHITASLIIFIFAFGLRGIFWRGASSFVPLYLVEIRLMSVEFAALLFALLMGAGAFGQVMGGYISDKVSRRLVIIASTIITMLFMFFATAVPLTWVGVSLCILGFAYFTGIPSFRAMIADLSPTSSLATTFGLAFATTGAISGVVAIILGYVADLSGLETVFLLVIILLAPVILLIFFVRKENHENLFHSKRKVGW